MHNISLLSSTYGKVCEEKTWRLRYFITCENKSKNKIINWWLDAFGHTRYKPVRFMRPSSSYFASSIENLHCSVMSLSLSLKTVTKLRHHAYKYINITPLWKNIIVMKTNER